jgi:hypothetical protein
MVQNSTIADGAVGVEVTGTLATFTLSNNIVTANQTGVQIDAGTAVSTSDFLSGNSITANSGAGLLDDGAGALNARSNYWGSSTGPTYPANNGGAGQPIIDFTDGGTGTGIVLFNPFLKATPFTPVVTWANPADIIYGTPLDGTELDAVASVPGTFSYGPAPGTVLSAGVGQMLSVTFTPTDSADYNSATASATINVDPAQLTVTADNQSMSYGSAVPLLSDSITGLVNGDDASVVSGTPLLSTTASSSSHPGSYPISIDISGLSAANYTFVGQGGTLTINTASPAITWATLAPITYRTALSGAQLDATASVPGTFVYTPAVGTVLGAGAQTLSVTFTPSDTVDYHAVTATALINVQKATPVVTWANPADITYGSALSATQLDAGASVPGSFVYSPALGSVPSAGANQTLSATFTPNDAIDYAPVTTTTKVTVNPAPLVIAANTSSKVYGQPNPVFSVTYSGFTNGDSPSSLSGSLIYSTAATTSSPVASYAVVPGGLTSPNYSITFVGANLLVSPAPLVIKSNNQSRPYGQPNPTLTATYQGFVNGDTPADRRT